MRNVCSIVTVSKVEPIEGADRIQFISMSENEYQIIGDKAFKAGDLAVYCETDTVLPVKPEFEFLRSRCFKEKYNGFLIKAMKMRGVVSCGIMFPLDILPKGKYVSGKDVTSVIGAIKLDDIVEEPQGKKKNYGFIKFLMSYKFTRPLGRFIMAKLNVKKISGNFPSSLISKSDVDNIMNNKDYLEKYKDVQVYASIKMEGQSATFLCDYKNKKIGKFFCCSKNQAFVNKEIGGIGKAMQDIAVKYNLEKKIADIYKDTGMLLAIQGEVCRPSVQKNIYKFTQSKLFVFKMKDLVTNRVLSFDEMQKVAWDYCIELVYILGDSFILSSKFSSIFDCNDFCKRYFLLGVGGSEVVVVDYEKPDNEKVDFKTVFLHEGVVITACDSSFSFKIKNDEYKVWF